MRRLISSRLTFVQKFISPLVGLLIIGSFFGSVLRTEPNIGFFVFLFVAALIGGAFYFLTTWPAKVVHIDGENLYVSNYRREITIPLADIDGVSDFILSNPRTVTIKLKKPSEFGDKIVFIAQYRWIVGFDSHPIVDELTRLAAEKQGIFYPSMLNLP